MPTQAKAINLKPMVFKTPPARDTLNPAELNVPALVRPFNQEVNPFTAGMQLGALGAAAGVGLAGIQRAIRLKAGDRTPVSVYKPMVIGAVIGAALGTAGGYKTLKKVEKSQPYPPPQTWAELSERLGQDAYSDLAPKYAGLNIIVKRAQLGSSLAQMGLYFVPGVSSLMYGRDALGSLKGLGSDVMGGNWKGAIGSGLGLLGNVAGAAAGLFGLGGVARGIKGLASVAKLGKGLSGPAAATATRWATGRLGPLWQRMAPAAAKLTPYANKLQAFDTKLQPYQKYRGRLGTMGYASLAAPLLGGGMGGGMPAGEPMPAGPVRPTGYRGGYDARGIALPGSYSNAMPQFEVPNVNFS